MQLGAVKVVFGHFLGTYKFLLGGGQAHVSHRITLKRNAAYFIANLSQNIEFHDDLVQVKNISFVSKQSQHIYSRMFGGVNIMSICISVGA